MRFTLTLCLLILFSHTNSQTVVIARKTKNAIYVAADSRTKMQNVNIQTGETTFIPGSMCKIYTCGKFNFAVIGNQIDKNAEKAKEACMSSDTFDEVIAKYATSFSKEIKDYLTSMKTALGYNSFQNIYPAKGAYSQCIFFGVQADTLFQRNIASQINYSNIFIDVDVIMRWHAAKTLGGGHIEGIEDTLQKETTWQKNVVKTLKYFINKQSKVFPNDVGGPIDIIRVTRRKTKWIQRKQECN